jgi:hypothetical protein
MPFYREVLRNLVQMEKRKKEKKVKKIFNKFKSWNGVYMCIKMSCVQKCHLIQSIKLSCVQYM